MGEDDYHGKKWFALYRAALLELNQSLVAGRIRTARDSIAERVALLFDTPEPHSQESLAISDAASGLRALEIEDNRLAVSKQREDAPESLNNPDKNLRS
jgi:hypothetical protein